MRTLNTKKGFTLIETLVAISILMLSVTGPLYFSSESLKAATYARDQITAFYLAQDAFEQIRAVRDNNVNASGNWLSGIVGPTASKICNNTNGCKIDPFSGSLNLIPQVCSGSCGKIKIDLGTGYYGYSSAWTETAFIRKITVEPTDLSAPDPTQVNEVKVTVKINWMSGTIARDFEVYEFLRGTPVAN